MAEADRPSRARAAGVHEVSIRGHGGGRWVRDRGLIHAALAHFHTSSIFPEPASARMSATEQKAMSGSDPAARRIRDAWLTGVAHALVSAAVLLATGHNIVLSAHHPMLSAAAILLLALGARRGSRAALLILLLATITPAAIKLVVGALHAADLPAFPLAALYARGLVGTVQARRPARAR